MASLDRCSVCRKGAGTCFCPGCKAYFCDDDFKDHRGMLINELDELTVDRNDLQEKLNRITSNKETGGHLLSQIDEWQQTTIEKVKQVAEQARQQIFQIMNLKREEITRQFQTMTQEITQLRDTRGVVEHDLARLKQHIDQLNEDLEELSQPSTIEVNTKQCDQIEWDRMMYVEEKPAYTGGKQLQSQSEEKQPTAAKPAQTKLECGGQVCNKCRKCHDWYRDDNSDDWHHRGGDACNWSPYDDDYNDSFLEWYGHLCRCEDNS